MDIRSSKELFLENLELDNDQKRAVELAIDCIIENEAREEDLPIVLISTNSYLLEPALDAVQAFFEQIYPKADANLFVQRRLTIWSSSYEDACVELIKQLRVDSGLLYYAESYSSISMLPSDIFHVVTLERGDVTRGKNQRGQAPEPSYITYKKHTIEDELFTNFHHSSSNEITTEDKFYLEADSKILRPIPAPMGAEFDKEITINSPTWQKHACVALRRYQAKECRDGMQWNVADEGWQNLIVYPVIDVVQSLDSSTVRECLIGLITVNTGNPDHPYLSTAWIHPFYRRQGRMTKLWKQLTDKYGTLDVEEPNSDMQSFLNKVNNRP